MTALREIRIYVDEALHSGVSLRLPKAAAEHVVRVLRLRVGAVLTLFNGRGGEFAATLSALESRVAVVDVGLQRAIERESPLGITLLQGLSRGEKMDWVVQKATELGVRRIIPVASERSVVQLEEKRAERRVEHWRDIAIAACEQCGRNRLPEVTAPMAMVEACAVTPAEAEGQLMRVMLRPESEISLGRIAAERGHGRHDLALLIGPEGGFTEAEVAIASRAGFIGARLGPRVLRTETAAVAALAALQACRGDF